MENVRIEMKILIVSQYFWPENFRINDLSSELSKRGHKVTILTGKPNYPEGRFNYEFVIKQKPNYWIRKWLLAILLILAGL